MKDFFKSFWVIVFLCSVVACKKEELPQDVPPPFSAMIIFTVSDADTGADLLNPDVENCLLEKVRVTYDGKVYQYDIDNGYGIYTTSGPNPFRLRWGHFEKKRSGDPYCLALGEFFCGKESSFGANLSVDWGDGGETTEVMFRFENVYGDRTRYLEANGIPAVPAPLDANYTPLQTGDIPPVCYWDRYLFINVKR